MFTIIRPALANVLTALVVERLKRAPSVRSGNMVEID